jgi:hypothetical protein
MASDDDGQETPTPPLVTDDSDAEDDPWPD